MSKFYSDQFILGLHHANPQKMGVKLAKICVKAGLPAKYVADVFDVSRMTIHSWFRGGLARDKNNIKIKNFIAFIEKGLKNGDLPVGTIKQARIYLATIKPNLIRV
jgi:hypothetical protein